MSPGPIHSAQRTGQGFVCVWGVSQSSRDCWSTAWPGLACPQVWMAYSRWPSAQRAVCLPTAVTGCRPSSALLPCLCHLLPSTGRTAPLIFQ